MILSTFENANKKAEVWQDGGILVIKFYENNQYLHMQIAGILADAEDVANNWTLA